MELFIGRQFSISSKIVENRVRALVYVPSRTPISATHCDRIPSSSHGDAYTRIEIINNTRKAIVMFIQAKKGNASNGGRGGGGGQIQVPDAKLRRLTVFFIVYNIFIKMNILSAALWASIFTLLTIR